MEGILIGGFEVLITGGVLVFVREKFAPVFGETLGTVSIGELKGHPISEGQN